MSNIENISVGSKVNIIGLTESTISFSSVDTSLRGVYVEEVNDPCSIARNILIKSQDQIKELRHIEDIGLIKVEEVVEEENEELVEEVVEEVVEEENEELVEEVVEEENEELVEEEKFKNPIEIIEESIKKDNKKKKPKKIKRSKKISGEEVDSEVVVMTEVGPRSGNMVHKLNGEIDENDPICKESMEAMEKLEKIADEEDEPIDESLLDPSERMSSTAVIGTGNGKAEVTQLKNSVIGPKPEPQFIDDILDEFGFDDELFEEKTNEEEKPKEKPKEREEDDPFIDLEFGEDDEDTLGDEFI